MHHRTVKHLSLWLAGLVISSGVASLAAGCGSSGNSPSGGIDGGLVQPDGSIMGFNGGDDGGTDGSTILQGALVVAPTVQTLTATTGQPPPTLQFSATVGGVLTSVAWGVDRGEIGTIDNSGLFTATGNIAGTATVTAYYGGAKTSTTVTVTIKTVQQGDPAWTAGPLDAGAGGYRGVGGDGPGATPTMAQVTTLQGAPMGDGAAPDPTVSILYPYDATVWPQGLLAPLLQWNPGAHSFDSVYVHITEKNYEYQGYFAANKTPFVNLPIPQSAWDAATLSNSGDAFVITLVFAQGANVYGPYTESWTIAQAPLQGTIYYNSYGTALVQNSNSNDSYGKQYGAGTLSIATGAVAPTLVAGIDSPGTGTGCRVCHTVSADGKSLVTQASNANAGDYSQTEFLNLINDTTGGSGTPTTGKNLAFPALYKDGSLLLSGAGGMINGDNGSHLYALPAGTPITATGLPAGFDATLPAFSPDGKHVSFNFWSGTFAAGTTVDGGTAALNGDQSSLAMLDFDGTSTFTNPRVIFSPGSATPVTYSSFLPNSAGVVFEVELHNAGSWGYTWQGNTGELWWVDTASATAHRLDQLNGNGPTAPYLPSVAPRTAAQDVTLNYEPTVNPIASGGYAWVVFTSRRIYGNVAQLSDPWQSDPRNYPWQTQVTDKKLWVAAVDLNAPPGTDPSHPAFYLPAQELQAGNSRGYWSVDACKADGMSCAAGDQCCGGYCQPGEAGLVCSSTMPTCSAAYEKCTTTADCCGSQQGITCINNVCSVSQPPAK
jgi:hypothetical protein